MGPALQEVGFLVNVLESHWLSGMEEEEEGPPLVWAWLWREQAE